MSANLTDRARAWQRTREAILDTEGETGHLDVTAIQDSDDDAVSIADDVAALATVVDAVSAIDSHLWWDMGPTLTCSESDAIANLFDSLGLSDAAASLREAHAEGDDEGDDHWQDDDDEDQG